MWEKKLAEMRNQMLRETQVFLDLHLNDRVPRFHDEPSLTCQTVVSQPSWSTAGVEEVADDPTVGSCARWPLCLFVSRQPHILRKLPRLVAG
jgi:hypothetical protein